MRFIRRHFFYSRFSIGNFFGQITHLTLQTHNKILGINKLLGELFSPFFNETSGVKKGRNEAGAGNFFYYFLARFYCPTFDLLQLSLNARLKIDNLVLQGAFGINGQIHSRLCISQCSRLFD